MSILLSRLLRQAEAKHAAGDAAAAETLCCQALSGAAALSNVDLVRDAALLLNRLPWVSEEERGSAVLALNNQIVTMQPQAIDDERALLLLESLLLLTPPYPHLHTSVMNMGVYFANRIGPERRHIWVTRLLQELDARSPAGDSVDRLEVEASEGPAAAAAVLANRGSVLIRNLLDTRNFGPLRDAAERYFDLHNEQATVASRIGDVEPLLNGPGRPFLLEMMRPFFPVPPDMQPRQTFMRRVAAKYPETTVPFHQDVQAFGKLMVNCWTPLTPAGGDAPGIELVATRLRDLPETIEGTEQYHYVEIAEEVVKQRYGEAALYRPVMQPGDVLAFLGTTIHRTHLLREMTQERLSAEIRFGLE